MTLTDEPGGPALPERIAEWRDVGAAIHYFSYYAGHDWLFRGVTDAAYGLRPKVGRDGARKIDRNATPPARVPYSLADERAVFKMFRQQARAHVTNVPGTDLEWLALAQHFGLPARLLDWTDSFLAAVWFAVEKAGNKNSKTDGKKPDSIVWITREVRTVDDESLDPFAASEPLVYRPPHINPRIAAQGSVLMVCPQRLIFVSASSTRY